MKKLLTVLKTSLILAAIVMMGETAHTQTLVNTQSMASYAGLFNDPAPSQGRRNLYLVDVLNELEVKYNVSFHYDHGLIRGLYIANLVSLNNEEYKIEDILPVILDPLDLEFRKVGSKIYLIVKGKEEEKRADRMDEVTDAAGLGEKVYFSTLVKDIGAKYILPAVVDVVISGRVTSNAGERIPGVNIIYKGTTIGTVTDVEGNYSLSVPSAQGSLVFSYIGFTPQEIEINGRTLIDVVLQEDIRTLEEVVVVGYGVQKKINLTGAVDVISGEQIENRQAATVSQILQGQSPGLTFSTNNSGFQPGASMDIDIRGTGSVNGGSPLVLIDGFPGDMDRLNPGDIESVSVLKDAAASAIYGARAPYGVILITTKSGKKNEKLSISYSGNISINKPDRLPEMLDSYVFARVVNEMGDNGGGRPYSQSAVDRVIAFQNQDLEFLKQFMPDDVTHYEAIVLPNGRWGHNQNSHANYDWYDEYFGSSVNQKHDLSIRGGSEKTTYYFSAGYFEQGSVLNYGTDTYQRYNLTGKVSTSITDWLDFRYETRFMKGMRQFPNLTNNWDYDLMFRQIARTAPTQSKYDGYGNYSNQSKIPFLEQAGTNLIETTDNWQTVSMEIRPLQGWKINGSFAYRSIGVKSSDQNLTFLEPYADGSQVAFAGSVPSRIEQTHENDYYWSGNVFTSYERSLNKAHNFFAMAGVQYELYNGSELTAAKTDLLVPQVPSLQTAIGSIVASESLNHWATQGYFGRFSYNFNEKYLFEANGRYDGTSRFKETKRWGFFPSFSVGWNIFKEGFWEPIEPVVNSFKIRASWGQLGNQQVQPYMDLALIPLQAGQLNWLFNYGASRPVGYASTPSLISPDLTWETATTKNVGANLSFLENRLQADIDLFERVTENMIGPSEPVPGVLGSLVPLSNNASLRSRGWEISLRWNHKLERTGLTYFVNMNLHNVNTVVTEYLNPSGLVSNWYPGKAVGEIWGYTADDLFKSQEEVDAYLADVDMSFLFNDWNPGDLKYLDINGDGKINAGSNSLANPGDLSIIGNSSPRYQFGFNAGLNYKGFDFSFLLQGTARRDYSVPVNGEQYMFWGINSWLFTSLTPEHLDYFRDQPGDKYVGLYEGEANINTDSYWPRPYLNLQQNNKNRHPSTRYLLNAAYLRLQNVQLGYSLPSRVLDKIHLQKLRFFVSGENLFTRTSLLKGIDPVALGPSDRIGMTYGADKIFSVGINASL